MSPTFFPRSAAFVLGYNIRNDKVKVAPHPGRQPCLCFDHVGKDQRVGHEILAKTCFTCFHETALEHRILHAAGHLQMLHKHQSVFVRQRTPSRKVSQLIGRANSSVLLICVRPPFVRSTLCTMTGTSTSAIIALYLLVSQSSG